MKGRVRRRGPDTYQLIIELGRNKEGTRKFIHKTVHGTEEDAERELILLQHQVITGSYIEPSRLTLGEYLEGWLADYCELHLAPKTVETYRDFVVAHIEPELGFLKLSELNALHLDRYYAQKLKHGRKDGKGGLAASTVLHHHRMLRTALQHAVRKRLILQNPADLATPPRVEKKERPTAEAASQERILAASAKSWLYIPILLAMYAGLRRGEVLGLRWSDINLDSGEIRIERIAQRLRDEQVAFKAPKTPKSIRTVEIGPAVVDVLRRHKAQQAQARLTAGPRWEDQGLVVCLPNGRPRNPDNLSHEFLALVRRLGFPDLNFHDLRHTHATDLLEDGVDLTIVSRRLGHSGIAITADIYGHVRPGMQRPAAEAADRRIRRFRGGE